MMTTNARPYLWNILFLMVALILSVAIGSIFIPPGTLIRILLTQFPGLAISPDWPDTFTAILLKIRLPHTALVTLTGAALAGSGAAYQGVFRKPVSRSLSNWGSLWGRAGGGSGISNSMAQRLVWSLHDPHGCFLRSHSHCRLGIHSWLGLGGLSPPRR